MYAVVRNTFDQHVVVTDSKYSYKMALENKILDKHFY
jgi:hypothetical protein